MRCTTTLEPRGCGLHVPQVHIDQKGGGIRLIMTGTLGLGPVLAKVLNVIAPNLPTKFSGDIGVMLRIQDIKGQKKVRAQLFGLG